MNVLTREERGSITSLVLGGQLTEFFGVLCGATQVTSAKYYGAESEMAGEAESWCARSSDNRSLSGRIHRWVEIVVVKVGTVSPYGQVLTAGEQKEVPHAEIRLKPFNADWYDPQLDLLPGSADSSKVVPESRREVSFRLNRRLPAGPAYLDFSEQKLDRLTLPSDLVASMPEPRYLRARSLICWALAPNLTNFVGYKPLLEESREESISFSRLTMGRPLSSSSYAERTVKTIDDGMISFDRCDLDSPQHKLANGITIKLGSLMTIDSRDWFPVAIIESSCHKAVGYVLASSLRSHTAFL